MAVNLSKNDKAQAKAQAQQAAKAGTQDQAKDQNQAPVAAAKAPEVTFLKLAQLSTYVHSDGSVFRGADIYEVTLPKAEELLAEASPAGVPYFKEVADPDATAVVSKIAKVAQTVEPDPAPAETGDITTDTQTQAQGDVIDTTAGEDEDDLGDDTITITHAEGTGEGADETGEQGVVIGEGTGEGSEGTGADADNTGETDTGTVALKDANGTDVGVTV